MQPYHGIYKYPGMQHIVLSSTITRPAKPAERTSAVLGHNSSKQHWPRRTKLCSFGAAGSDETAVPRAPLRRQASEGNGVGGTSIPKLARQFSSDSETRIVDGLQPAPLVAKVAALLRAAHAVHAPLHTSPLLRGPQPGDAVLAEYMEAGGKL